jgi:hypothetical protein
VSPPLNDKGETGFRPDPISEPDIAGMFSAGFRNSGGRPRKDGSRADARPTLADAGFSKRVAARMRALADLTDDEFDAALARFDAEWIRTGRKPAFERFISKRGDNSRLERETDANVARIASTLRRIEHDYHGDCSQTGESMRIFVEMMRGAWREWVTNCGNSAANEEK